MLIQNRVLAVTQNVKRKIDTHVYQITNGSFAAPLPQVVSLPLLAQCNKRCNFCEIVGVINKLKIDGKSYQANILTLDYVKQFKTVLKTAQAVDFGGLTGLGEPLLSPYFQEIVSYIRSINPVVTFRITTNATLLDKKKADFLIFHSPIGITFSLHAVTEKTYEKTMGADYKKVIENVRYFCKTSKDNVDIVKSINFGFGKHNYKDAKKIIEFAKKNNINSINIYPYYKSPNAFMEDMSLYSQPALANRVLDEAYKKARKLHVSLRPTTPAYIKMTTDKSRKKAITYSGGCPSPYTMFMLKADAFSKNRLALSVCNRIVPFQIDLTKKITTQDINWAWNHSIIKAMRLAKQGEMPAICKFCMNPQTPVLRSLNHIEYKKQRDAAVKTDLLKHSKDKYSPNRSIRLLSLNIYSI